MDNTELFKIKTQWEKHNWQEQTIPNATKNNGSRKPRACDPLLQQGRGSRPYLAINNPKIVSRGEARSPSLSHQQVQEAVLLGSGAVPRGLQSEPSIRR